MSPTLKSPETTTDGQLSCSLVKISKIVCDFEQTILECSAGQTEGINCYLITIAHRLNTLKDCQMILVLKDGKVDEFEKFCFLVSSQI